MYKGKLFRYTFTNISFEEFSGTSAGIRLHFMRESFCVFANFGIESCIDGEMRELPQNSRKTLRTRNQKSGT
ncbi:hypothetical protein LEP1GSC188_0210 [Leptospira weilii serovar Topaz str. LT2116]|uniref:Uncharacterized protein n=1 Tax=Leptospira weilii serovar Topaz str. LT2116 TaxID=1088540 RepID=M3EN46_9LEPT|nr:hypothetical protein LEP1GSC188_0210 [Leptospira weilii serovar Topaz str. LT2116]